MPTYDYRCKKCNWPVEDVFMNLKEHETFAGVCQREGCGGELEQSVGFRTRQRPWVPWMSKHVSLKGPVEMTSMRQMEKVMKENNMAPVQPSRGMPGCEPT